MAETKRGRGRPQVHGETKLIQIRVPVHVGTILTGVIETLKMLEQDTYMPAPVVLIGAFRARLKQLGNRSPVLVENALKNLDRAMQEYEYVEVLDRQRKAARKAKQA